MVAGVLAATITITSNPYTGEAGTLHNNTGTMTVVDKGLSIVSNVTGITTINSTATFGATGTNANLFNGSTFTVGHWMETIVFTDTATGGSHSVTIKIQGGSSAVGGASLAGSPITLTLTGPGSASSGTVTENVDLGVSTITAPMTVYVTAT
jgi:hypothetical protein